MLEKIKGMFETLFSEKFVYKYRLVKIDVETGFLRIHCKNTNAIFHTNVSDLVSDLKLLYEINPVHACCLGILFAQKSHRIRKKPIKHSVISIQSLHYENTLLSFDRNGKISFVNNITKEITYTDATNIAIDTNLISTFSPIDSFFIGINAVKRPKLKASMERPNKYLYVASRNGIIL